MELLTVICNFHLLVNILVRGVYCQSFTSKPNSPVYQLKGQSVTLSWTYNTAGKTVTQVWWFHNNNWIASRQPSGQTSVLNARHQVSGPATLTISNVQTKDYGEYECQVTFSSGRPPLIKATAELIVVVRPSIILKTKTAQTLDEGASLKLLCVASGNPKPSYTWYKDSVKIQEDPNSSNYTITSANRNDAGKYRCEAVVNATTLGQYSVPYSVQVTVSFKPAHKVNSLSSNQTVLQGNDATFYCLTEAFPTATTYRWFKDDNQITNSANFEIFNAGGAEESRLTIKNAQNGTAGQYSCDGTNRVGTGERKTAFLLVNSEESQDLSIFPSLTFDDVGQYAKKMSGCTSTAKAYKFMAEPGYLHEIKVIRANDAVKIASKCFRSMKKNEPPHSLEVSSSMANNSLSGRCSCVAGSGGYCHHVIGLLYYLALLKQLGHRTLPDDLTCTSMKQRWSVPRGKKIEAKQIQNVLVKKPQLGASFNKYIKSNLYSPSPIYGTMTKEHFNSLQPKPLFVTIVPSEQDLRSVSFVPSKFGNVPKGCLISYQQKMSADYLVNDFTCTAFPDLPLESANDRFQNNVSVCLEANQQALFDSLSVTSEISLRVQEETITQSLSETWRLLRKKRITASKFGTVARRVSNFENLVSQLNPARFVQTPAMKRGVELEPHAATVYANVAKNGRVNLFPSGLIINPKCPWLGCSPDRKVYDLDALGSDQNPFGLLEVKVVREGATSFDDVRYLTKDNTNQYSLKKSDIYYYQVQCQLGLTGLDWCDFFSYMNDDMFVCTRILFDPIFFQGAKDKVDIFFFNYYLS